MLLLALSAPQVQANNRGLQQGGRQLPGAQDWALTPSNLNAGDKFRLLFASSTTRNARPQIHGQYDTFVQNRAKAGHAGITDGCASKFNALISTRYDGARGSTRTTSSDTDASIWWLAGEKVADDYADFYDGSWDSRNHKNESGGTTSHKWVRTGSNSGGSLGSTHYAGKPLGNTLVANLNNNDPLSSGTENVSCACATSGTSNARWRRP